jgi:hypothetical protein
MIEFNGAVGKEVTVGFRMPLVWCEIIDIDNILLDKSSEI